MSSDEAPSKKIKLNPLVSRKNAYVGILNEYSKTFTEGQQHVVTMTTSFLEDLVNELVSGDVPYDMGRAIAAVDTIGGNACVSLITAFKLANDDS